MTRNDRTRGAGWLSRLLAALQGLVLLVAAAVALWLIISFPLWWYDAPRIPLPVPVAVAGHEELITLSDEAAGIGRIEFGRWRGELEIRFANAWAQWFYIVVGLGQILLVALILNRLRLATGAFARGEGLSRNTASHLRWAGALMIVEAIIAPGIAMSVSALVVNQLGVTGSSLMVDWLSEFGQHGLIGGWVILILSEAVRQGAELRDDQSLTI